MPTQPELTAEQHDALERMAEDLVSANSHKSKKLNSAQRSRAVDMVKSRLCAGAMAALAGGTSFEEWVKNPAMTRRALRASTLRPEECDGIFKIRTLDPESSRAPSLEDYEVE